MSDLPDYIPPAVEKLYAGMRDSVFPDRAAFGRLVFDKDMKDVWKRLDKLTSDSPDKLIVLVGTILLGFYETQHLAKDTPSEIRQRYRQTCEQLDKLANEIERLPLNLVYGNRPFGQMIKLDERKFQELGFAIAPTDAIRRLSGHLSGLGESNGLASSCDSRCS